MGDTAEEIENAETSALHPKGIKGTQFSHYHLFLCCLPLSSIMTESHLWQRIVRQRGTSLLDDKFPSRSFNSPVPVV